MKILVAIDGSESAKRAALAAQQLFGPDAEYLAIHVADSPTDTSTLTLGTVYGYPWAGGMLDRLAEESLTVVSRAGDDAEQYSEAAGIDAEPVGAVGDPAGAIVQAASDHHVDAIVVGHQHRNWFVSLFEPSVADRVVDLAHVPVVIVPAPD